jgi:hypothetical protein
MGRCLRDLLLELEVCSAAAGSRFGLCCSGARILKICSCGLSIDAGVSRPASRAAISRCNDVWALTLGARGPTLMGDGCRCLRSPWNGKRPFNKARSTPGCEDGCPWSSDPCLQAHDCRLSPRDRLRADNGLGSTANGGSMTPPGCYSGPRAEARSRLG